MENAKITKHRKSYDTEFKEEIIKMQVSGKSVKEVSVTFGIAEKRGAVAASVSLENSIKNEDKG
jgi:hypothetical protein